MMRRHWILILGLIISALHVTPGWSRDTETLYLSGTGSDDRVTWEFYCSEGRRSGAWTTIEVPSNWEFEGFGRYNYGRDRKKSQETGRYRYSFRVPQAWQDKQVSLVFEGVMTDTEAWINGQSVGPIHQGGFYRFSYDITEMINPGQSNLLEVLVHKVSANRSVEQAERQADYWVFGGIYRPVYLEAVPQQHIKRCAIDARASGQFSVDVYLSQLNAAGPLVATITGPGLARPYRVVVSVGLGQEKATLTTTVESIKPWTAETPSLYTVDLSLQEEGKTGHSVSERFGFRTFEVRPGQGLYLNGQKIILKGVNRHSFWPDSGRCLNRSLSYADVHLLKEMNMNAVRMSHYPPD
ncbi:MAG: glycoside hydrolase family 2, partial [Planctomycetes bacterium]|nr:glycoside hydrolase family 2 [Planctomycetota bacterium]